MQSKDKQQEKRKWIENGIRLASRIEVRQWSLEQAECACPSMAPIITTRPVVERRLMSIACFLMMAVVQTSVPESERRVSSSLIIA